MQKNKINTVLLSSPLDVVIFEFYNDIFNTPKTEHTLSTNDWLRFVTFSLTFHFCRQFVALVMMSFQTTFIEFATRSHYSKRDLSRIDRNRHFIRSVYNSILENAFVGRHRVECSTLTLQSNSPGYMFSVPREIVNL